MINNQISTTTPIFLRENNLTINKMNLSQEATNKRINFEE